MTIKNNHGPWKTFRMYTGQLYIKDSRGHAVCEVKSDTIETFLKDREANAKLIASAPEILEALEWMLAAHNHPEHAGADVAVDRARKALAKVRG